MSLPAGRRAGNNQGGEQIGGDRRKADLGRSERRSTIIGAVGLIVSVDAASAAIGSADFWGRCAAAMLFWRNCVGR